VSWEAFFICLQIGIKSEGYFVKSPM
jgi:hypothetical protein